MPRGGLHPKAEHFESRQMIDFSLMSHKMMRNSCSFSVGRREFHQRRSLESNLGSSSSYRRRFFTRLKSRSGFFIPRCRRKRKRRQNIFHLFLTNAFFSRVTRNYAKFSHARFFSQDTQKLSDVEWKRAKVCANFLRVHNSRKKKRIPLYVPHTLLDIPSDTYKRFLRQRKK